MFLLGIFVLFLGLVIFLLSGFLTPLVLGILFASLSYRFYIWIRKAVNGHATLAALLVVIAITFLIIIPFLTLTTLLANEALQLFLTSRESFALNHPLMQTAASFLARFNIDLPGVFQEQVAPTLQNIGGFLTRQIGNLLSNALLFTLDFFILILTVFYLLRDGQALGSFLMEVSPLADRDNIKLFQTFLETGRAVFYGNFVSAVAQGTLGGIGFALFGLSAPVLWGTVMAFLAFIPFLGAYLIFIPATIYLFLTADLSTVILFFLFNLLLVSTVDNIIKPKLISAKIRVHPLFTMLAVFGGIKLFGILGIIYGPLIASIFLVLFDMYRERVKPALLRPVP